MNMMHHTKTLGIVQVDEAVWKRLSSEEKEEIARICDEKLTEYYSRLA
jgi:TRAP-type C4-dicarboxylate transport system substrate-binding protein